MARRAPSMPQKGTRPERRLEFALRALGVHGWETAPRDVHAYPEFYWRGQEVAVFVDGCQWHACPQHFRPHVQLDPGPRPHRLTREGAALQRHRDRLQRSAMQARGLTVLAFWEHEVNRDAGQCASLVASALEARERLKCR